MSRRYEWVPIASTGERFAGFAPYVPSVARGGRVAFQAALVDGGSGVFIGDGDGNGDAIATIACTGTPDGFAEFDSHPALATDGTVSFYAGLTSGGRGVFIARDGRIATIADTRGGLLADVGPLGPTMNDAGTVAFRAQLGSGEHGVFAGDGAAPATIAVAGEAFSAFDGLPVIAGDGAVVFRDARGIHRWRDGAIETVAVIGERFRELGRFPCANHAGRVAFVATLATGEPGVFVEYDHAIASAIAAGVAFESFRGVLLDRHGLAVFYATPTGGQLGLYTGPAPNADRVLGPGDPILNSTVTAFALNPVSITDDGILAARVVLANGAEAILRGDPLG